MLKIATGLVVAGALGAVGYFIVAGLLKKGETALSAVKQPTGESGSLPSRSDPLKWVGEVTHKVNDLTGIIGDVIAGAPRVPRADTPQPRRTYRDSAGNVYYLGNDGPELRTGSLGGPITGYGEPL